MIVDALFDLLFGLLDAGLSLLPSGAGLVLPGTPLWSVLSTANVVLPVDLFLITLGFSVQVMTVGLVYWGIMKVLNLLRGSGA